MKIAVTGANGFVGRAFVRAASSLGHEILCVGRTPLEAVGFIHVDLRSGAGLDEVQWREFDAVVHLAAAGVKAAKRSWPECVMVNVVGTQRLLTAISAAKARPMTWIAQTFYEREAVRHNQLLENPYVATKIAGSELARDWARRTSNRLVFGRLFQGYGPGDDSGNLLSYAAHQLRRGEPALLGSGVGVRDWIFVDDLARGILASIVAVAGSNQDSVFDLGTGVSTSIREALELLADLANAPRHLLHFDPIRDRRDLSIESKAINLPPGWCPVISLREGIKQLLNDPV